MPTLILTDTSRSLSEEVSDGQTKQDILQRGVLHLLTILAEQHPLELTSLVTFSSEVVSPFTRDYRTLKTALYAIELSDGNLQLGLETSINYVTHNLKNADAYVQFIIITTTQTSNNDLLNIYFPFPVKLHIIVLGDHSEQELEPYQHLCTQKSGAFYYIQLPHQKNQLKDKFQDIITVHYKPFGTLLMIGNICGMVSIYPNPNLSFYNSIAAQHDLPLWFPTVVSVTGFISLRALSSPPSVARYILLPVRSNSNQTTTPDDSTALLLLLHETLKKEKRGAVVNLGDKRWYGLIHVLTYFQSDKAEGGAQIQSSLALTVFPKDLSLDWLGNISDLAISSNRPSTSAIPLRPSTKKSYDTFSPNAYEMPCAETDTLTADINRVLNLVKELPGKSKALFKHCEKIRNKVNIFFLPGVLDCMTDLLNKELVASEEGSEAREILEHLTEQIIQNRNKPSQKPLTPPPPRERTQTRSSTRKSKKQKLSVHPPSHIPPPVHPQVSSVLSDYQEENFEQEGDVEEMEGTMETKIDAKLDPMKVSSLLS